jgi:hypothetical protein
MVKKIWRDPVIAMAIVAAENAQQFSAAEKGKVKGQISIMAGST